MARIKPLPRDRVAYRYRPKYGVIILCADEASQRCAYSRLRRAGYKVRVVTV